LALCDLVRGPLDKLRRGELDAADGTIKDAAALLRGLQTLGVRLYLANGTDLRWRGETQPSPDRLDGRPRGARAALHPLDVTLRTGSRWMTLSVRTGCFDTVAAAHAYDRNWSAIRQ
jgi:hypothetical protein